MRKAYILRLLPLFVLPAMLLGAPPFFTASAVANPAAEDSLKLSNITERAASINSLNSLLIQKEGELLSETYFNGMRASEATNIKSASKSIISLLVGIAIDKGIIEGTDQKIGHWFEGYFNDHPNSAKAKITIGDLLTMRAGLETTSFHNYGRWVTSDNWIHYALDQPMVEEPGGSEMVYSTGSSHLLSVILTKASGMSTRAFARRHLFGPMGIKPGGWDKDPQGFYFGGNNMALRPADMLKIGQMVLNGGTYNGQRIVSREWIDRSLKTYTRSNYNPYDYGYMWWQKPVAGYSVHFAWGYGGQYIFIIPELEAVVVMTGDLTGATQSRSYKEPVFDLLAERILPFLRSG